VQLSTARRPTESRRLLAPPYTDRAALPMALWGGLGEIQLQSTAVPTLAYLPGEALPLHSRKPPPADLPTHEKPRANTCSVTPWKDFSSPRSAYR